MLFWLTFGCAVAGAEIAPEAPETLHPKTARAVDFHCPCTCRRSGQWIVAESPNFSVWTHLSQSETAEIVRQCEKRRADLRASWIGEVIETEWHPRCYVIVHDDSGAFAQHVGTSLRPPVGCTTITRDHGRIVFRRIDLRCDAADWQANALPHELVHVVLADAFPEQELPAWLNEGLAMTFETDELRRRRLQVLHAGREQGRLPNMKQVFSAQALPNSQDADLIYAACLSIVSFLREHDGAPSKLLSFVKTAVEQGSETALLKIYGIAGGLAELERRWLMSLNEGAGIPHRHPIGTTFSTAQTVTTIAGNVARKSTTHDATDVSLPERQDAVHGIPSSSH